MLVAPELYSSDSATNGLKMIGGRFMKNGSMGIRKNILNNSESDLLMQLKGKWRNA